MVKYRGFNDQCFRKLSSWKASGSGFTGVQKLLNIIDKIKSEETSTRVGSAKRLNNDVARIGSAKLRSIQTCANTQNISVGCEDISEKNEIQAEKVSTSNLIDHPKQIKDIDEIIITSFVKSRSVTFNGSVTEIPEKNTDSENSVDHSEDRKSGEKNNEELAANIKTQDHKGETTYENPFPTDQNGFKLLSKDEIQLAIDTFFAGNLWEDFEFVTDMDRKPTQKYSKFVDIGRKPNAYRSARRKNGGGKLGAKLGVNALLSTQISTYCKSFEHLAQELQKKTDLTAEIKRLERADLLETDGEDIGIESLFENKTKIKTENPGSDTESVKDLQNLFEEPLVNIQKVQIDTVNVGVNPINFGAKWPSTTISSHEDKKENIAISTDEDSIFDLRDLFDEEKLRMAESSEAVSQSASPNEKVDDTYLNTAENFVEAKLVLPEPARDINGNSSSTKEVQKSEIDERETLDEDSIFDLSELFEDNLRSVKSDETVSQGAITAENVHDTVENFADVKAVPRSANSVGDISSSTKEIQKSRNNERKIQNEDSTDNESVMNIGGLFDEDLSLKSCSENRQEASIANQKSEEKLEETAGLIETHNSTITDGNPQKSYDQMVMENFFSRKEPEQPIVDDGDFVPSLNSTTELTPNDSGISDDCDSVVSGRGKSRNPPMPGVNSFNFILESDRKVIAEVHSQIEKESNQPMKQLNLWYNKIELPNDTEDDLLVQVPHKNLQKNRRKREKRRKAKQKKKMEKCCCHCQHHKYAVRQW